MTAADVVMGVLGLVAVGSAVLVVTSRHLVRAALWLVVTLGAVAGCFLVLGAELLAWVQVLIYVGAVVVLLLFGIMLTRAPVGPVDDLSGPRRLLAAAVAVATAGTLGTLVLVGFGGVVVDVDAATEAGVGSGEALGGAVFSTWVLPFELLSVLLLTALVSAIALSRRAEGADDPDESPSSDPQPAGGRQRDETRAG